MPDSVSDAVVSCGSATALCDALGDCTRVLLTGPVVADGDSLGACLALQIVLARRGIDADVAGVAAARYHWMPGIQHLIADDVLDADYDAVVVLDGDRHRLSGPVEALFARASVKGIIDHHASTELDGYTHTWVEHFATSTTQMLYQWFKVVDEPIDRTIAMLLYTGAMFDTGGFRYSNTTPATHRMAAELIAHGIDHADITTKVLMERSAGGLRCAGYVFGTARFHCSGAVAVGRVTLETRARFALQAGDLEGVVDSLLNVKGVQAAALLIQRSDQIIKASLRSHGAISVCDVAQGLAPTGGGHHKAAGACFTATIDDAETAVVLAMRQALGIAEPAPTGETDPQWPSRPSARGSSERL